MKQVQKLSDGDVIKIGFSFDKYISWNYFKTLINELITTKINEIPTPTLQEVTSQGFITTDEVDFQNGLKTTTIDLNDLIISNISVETGSSITGDRLITITIDGSDYKILAQRI